jgi:hypothetical protein
MRRPPRVVAGSHWSEIVRSHRAATGPSSEPFSAAPCRHFTPVSALARMAPRLLKGRPTQATAGVAQRRPDFLRLALHLFASLPLRFLRPFALLRGLALPSVALPSVALPSVALPSVSSSFGRSSFGGSRFASPFLRGFDPDRFLPALRFSLDASLSSRVMFGACSACIASLPSPSTSAPGARA